MTENKTNEELDQQKNDQTVEAREADIEKDEAAIEAAEADIEENESDDEASEPTDPKDDEIAALKQQVEAEENKYLKLYAEFDNFKRRNRQEMELNNKYKHQKIVEDLLPIIDNLERALKIEGESESFNSLLKGVEMVYNDLVNTLMKHDVKEIESTGHTFDPNFHQAVMTEASDEADGTIIEEFQKGYMLKDRVIRPSMVKVSE
ncbi:nucleotide exchange factor GrpE [Salinicoccus hispanicus]|uniref:Protein GrpE n=1 Tax=Salinicoccus hispanicus TaxID=157225 RepID=A0A6N8U1T3_9STAP|nr:nucleotide exchange factor GrpE [Salinicoccus hispanicus]MXQ50081.1 nucleotide exchange factor GrpE [Salinicoccus hispanicus]